VSGTGIEPRPAVWLFSGDRYRPVSRETLAVAGLPAEPLAAVSLTLARAASETCWHLVPPAGLLPSQCAGLRRAAAGSHSLVIREAGVLDGAELCLACASCLEVSDPARIYLRVVWSLLAARAWVEALESADWLDYARWTARTPFTDQGTSTAIASLAGSFSSCRLAALAQIGRLRDRAEAAWARARQAAGPPGLHAHVAAATAAPAGPCA
jgi:hypothetical protein